MNNQPSSPIDHDDRQSRMDALAANARIAFCALFEMALTAAGGAEQATRGAAAIRADKAAAELQTTFGDKRALSALYFATADTRACVGEFTSEADQPAVQLWTHSIWEMFVITLDGDAGKHGSIATHDAILTGRAAALAHATLSAQGFVLEGRLRSHGAESVLFQARADAQPPEPPLAVH